MKNKYSKIFELVSPAGSDDDFIRQVIRRAEQEPQVGALLRAGGLTGRKTEENTMKNQFNEQISAVENTETVDVHEIQEIPVYVRKGRNPMIALAASLALFVSVAAIGIYALGGGGDGRDLNPASSGIENEADVTAAPVDGSNGDDIDSHEPASTGFYEDDFVSDYGEADYVFDILENSHNLDVEVNVWGSTRNMNIELVFTAEEGVKFVESNDKDGLLLKELSLQNQIYYNDGILSSLSTSMNHYADGNKLVVELSVTGSWGLDLRGMEFKFVWGDYLDIVAEDGSLEKYTFEANLTLPTNAAKILVVDDEAVCIRPLPLQGEVQLETGEFLRIEVLSLSEDNSGGSGMGFYISADYSDDNELKNLMALIESRELGALFYFVVDGEEIPMSALNDDMGANVYSNANYEDNTFNAKGFFEFGEGFDISTIEAIIVAGVRFDVN
ncbi:MAG: hypothetical protein FWG83_05390 [Oscillospiraceae bacterium]|nr:hypothetical protein [Oscillospiraceae bacterium]